MRVLTKLKNGLGNKLFQLIHCLIVGEHYNRNVLIYNNISKHEKINEYELFKYFPRVKDLITQIDEKQYNEYDKKSNYLIDEEICFAKIDSEMIITKGYMMIKYYLLNDTWRKWILNILKPIPIKNSIINTPSLGIHIRVGDYLKYKGNKMFPLYKPEYYTDIIKKYPKHTIYFFTDTGHNFIRNQIIPKINNEYKFIDNNPLEDLITLSNCDILILSASTFSFWAGYLNYGKKYCPKYWLMIKIRLENSVIINTDRYIANDYSIYK